MRSVSPSPAGSVVERLILDAFGPDGPKAVKVARCESTLRPGATNGDSLGLFQIQWHWHHARAEKRGWGRGDMLRAEPNIAIALEIFREQSWRPWSCRWA